MLKILCLMLLSSLVIAEEYVQPWVGGGSAQIIVKGVTLPTKYANVGAALPAAFIAGDRKSKTINVARQ